MTNPSRYSHSLTSLRFLHASARRLMKRYDEHATHAHSAAEALSGRIEARLGVAPRCCETGHPYWTGYAREAGQDGYGNRAWRTAIKRAFSGVVRRALTNRSEDITVRIHKEQPQ